MYEYFDFDLSQASFEWDERKDQINFAKHGIHFSTAVKVFLIPICSSERMRSTRKNCDMISLARSEKCYSLFAHSEKRT